MDVGLKIRKHLARDSQSTVGIIDEYCADYRDIFKSECLWSLCKYNFSIKHESIQT